MRNVRTLFFSVVFLGWGLVVLGGLQPPTDGVVAASTTLESSVPVTIHLPAGDATLGPAAAAAPEGRRYPAVVLAHGYSGDRRGLWYLAASLARSGYVVVTYDAPGHGQNTQPFGDAGPTHQEAMRSVVEWTRRHPSVDRSKLAVGGHSMGAATAIEFASWNEGIAAVLAISGGWRYTGPSKPPNALFLVASGDPRYLKERVTSLAARVAENEAIARETVYGRFGEGSATAFVEEQGVDHLTIVGSPRTVRLVDAWLRRSFTGSDEGAPKIEPSQEARPLSLRYFRATGLLALMAFALAAGLGTIVGRIGSQGPRLEPVPVAKGGLAWAGSLGVALVAGAALGGSASVPLGVLGSVGVLCGAAGVGVAARWWTDDSLRRAQPNSDETGQPQNLGPTLVAVVVGSSGLVVVLASVVSRLHGVYLDPKRLVHAAISAALFFPGLWAIETLSRRGRLLRQLGMASLLKLSLVIAVAVSIAIGSSPRVLALGIPLLVGLLAFFEVFALAAARQGAPGRVVALCEAVTLGWLSSVIGPLQF